jgi:ABC-type spermidine/putrescine transport system permease subunit II
MPEANLTLAQRFARVALATLAALVLVFLVAPIVIIVPLSFSSGSFFYYPLPGFSLRWYEDFFGSSFWLPSVWNSLLVGTSATVLATLQGFNQNLVRASLSLGADPLTTFFRVTLPVIAPGVISGALFAFATSFDEVVVTLFLAGPGQVTLPRQMFTGIRENITPTIAAVATLLIGYDTESAAVGEGLARFIGPEVPQYRCALDPETTRRGVALLARRHERGGLADLVLEQ